MATGAHSGRNRHMDNIFSRKGALIMTIETDIRTDEQFLLLAGVRGVTVRAHSHTDWHVYSFFGKHRLVMARVAEVWWQLVKQSVIIRLVRIVAHGAHPARSGGM